MCLTGFISKCVLGVLVIILLLIVVSWLAVDCLWQLENSHLESTKSNSFQPKHFASVHELMCFRIALPLASPNPRGNQWWRGGRHRGAWRRRESWKAGATVTDSRQRVAFCHPPPPSSTCQVSPGGGFGLGQILGLFWFYLGDNAKKWLIVPALIPHTHTHTHACVHTLSVHLLPEKWSLFLVPRKFLPHLFPHLHGCLGKGGGFSETAEERCGRASAGNSCVWILHKWCVLLGFQLPSF